MSFFKKNRKRLNHGPKFRGRGRPEARLCSDPRRPGSCKTAQGPAVRISDSKHEPYAPPYGSNRHFGPKSCFRCPQPHPRPARQAPLPRLRPPNRQAQPRSRITIFIFGQPLLFSAGRFFSFKPLKPGRKPIFWDYFGRPNRYVP